MGSEPEASEPQMLVALGNSFFKRRIQGIRSSSTIRSKSVSCKIRIGIHVHDKLFEPPDVGCQAEGCTEL